MHISQSRTIIPPQPEQAPPEAAPQQGRSRHQARVSLRGACLLALAGSSGLAPLVTAAQTGQTRHQRLPWMPAAQHQCPAPTAPPIAFVQRLGTLPVERSLSRFIGQQAEAVRDARAQPDLPAHDADPACSLGDATMESIRSHQRWLAQSDIGSHHDFAIGRESELDFPIAAQEAIVDGLIATSPTLVAQLRAAHAAGVNIRWTEPGDPPSSPYWDPRQRVVWMPRLFRIHPALGVSTPAMVLESCDKLLRFLSHEITHAAQPELDLDPNAFTSRASHRQAVLAHFARSEAQATYNELRVAREVFDATGVVLKLHSGNYRCGDAQAIFHDPALNEAQKIERLALYMRAEHPAFATYYPQVADLRWEHLRNRA